MDDEKRLNNPAWHIHQGRPPAGEDGLSFNILLNLASVCHSEDKSVLWHFVSRYRPGATPENAPILDQLIGYAINYYRDFVKPAKQYRKANGGELNALKDLQASLSTIDKGADASAIQSEVYEVGKRHDFEDLKLWFKALYEILLGQSQGPRMGSFIKLYGIDETIVLLEKAINGDDLAAD